MAECIKGGSFGGAVSGNMIKIYEARTGITASAQTHTVNVGEAVPDAPITALSADNFLMELVSLASGSSTSSTTITPSVTYNQSTGVVSVERTNSASNVRAHFDLYLVLGSRR